ncbi:DNA cytosine methyltransferase [Actinomyces sp. 565]|nr:DNA cytosine methyltransferase [Actinomyces sp. 565]
MTTYATNALSAPQTLPLGTGIHGLLAVPDQRHTRGNTPGASSVLTVREEPSSTHGVTTLSKPSTYTSLEVCAGAGGQALGLEQAGFEHLALVELEDWACKTLRHNRSKWNIIQDDLNTWTPPADLHQVDLFAGGVPCPPFSVAGRQLGAADERNLFDRAIDIVQEIHPRGVMIENVRGLLDPKFSAYREHILARLATMGFVGEWRLLNASDYGVPQLRPRAVLVALKDHDWENFSWPAKHPESAKTVGETLVDLMGSRGWRGAEAWAASATGIAPTLVGGSKKHGGPDLGPTRARKAWAAMGVTGNTIADEPPGPDFEGSPRLTPQMMARIQGFPDSWEITGRKTNACRQIGNAFPPPVARAVGTSIFNAFSATDATTRAR